MKNRGAWSWQDFLDCAPGWTLDESGRPVPPAENGAAVSLPVAARVAPSAPAPASGHGVSSNSAGAHEPAPAPFVGDAARMQRARELLEMGRSLDQVLQAVSLSDAQVQRLRSEAAA